MTSPTNPICRDCRHSVMRRMHYLPIIRVLHCAHPNVLNCVSGEPVYTCAELRTTDSQFCGRAGAQWEAVNIVEAPKGEGTKLANLHRRENNKATKAYTEWLESLTSRRVMDWQDITVCETPITPDGPKIAKRFAAKVKAARTRAKKAKP